MKNEWMVNLRQGERGPYLTKHVSGPSCWCQPLHTPAYWLDGNPTPPGLTHRNYEWRDGEWHMLSTKGTP